MTDDQAPPAAVRIVRDVLVGTGGAPWSPAVVAALARRYAFVDHAEYARLRAVAEAARIYSESTRDHAYGNPNQTWRDLNDALARIPRAALDAAPAGHPAVDPTRKD